MRVDRQVKARYFRRFSRRHRRKCHGLRAACQIEKRPQSPILEAANQRLERIGEHQDVVAVRHVDVFDRDARYGHTQGPFQALGPRLHLGRRHQNRVRRCKFRIRRRPEIGRIVFRHEHDVRIDSFGQNRHNAYSPLSLLCVRRAERTAVTSTPPVRRDTRRVARRAFPCRRA